MYGANPEYEAGADDYTGAGSIVNSLSEQQGDLALKIGAWQNAIKGVQDGNNISQKDVNIARWYQFAHQSYASSKLRVSDRDKSLLNKFSEDPNYIFKSIVETVARELLSKYFRSLPALENTDIKVLVSSDFDDIKSGVDLIINFQEESGQSSTLGVDVAVSNNFEYLNEKSKRTQTYCMEYNLANKMAPKKKISRKVLYFDPKIMSDLVLQYLSTVEEGKYVDAFRLYQKISKNHHGSTLNYPGIRSQVTKQVDNILQIN